MAYLEKLSWPMRVHVSPENVQNSARNGRASTRPESGKDAEWPEPNADFAPEDRRIRGSEFNRHGLTALTLNKLVFTEYSHESAHRFRAPRT